MEKKLEKIKENNEFKRTIVLNKYQYKHFKKVLEKSGYKVLKSRKFPE